MKWRRWIVVLAFSVEGSLAFADERPPAPDMVVTLSWSSNFAALIVSSCEDYELDDESPEAFAYLSSMQDAGINLGTYKTDYAPVPPFDGDSTRSLMYSSNLADVFIPEGTPFCDFADLVYRSDMLAGHMIRLKDENPEAGS